MGDAVSLNTLEFAGARAQEIACMEEVLHMGRRDRAKRVFQRLPRHMRRRQMSHNVKRLPRNMRDQARAEMQSQGLTKTNGAPKRPSRFYRRRPRRLEEAYALRQKRVRWLETHIWHAKRFHMVEKWGYRLPDRPTDKGVRAAYRYASRYASLADMSYYQHLEIKGAKENISRLFEQLSRKNVGSTVGARRYESGAMRGRTVLYEPLVADGARGDDVSSYSGKVMCDVDFLWQPSATDCDTNDPALSTRALWLWVHPLSLARLLATINTVNALLDLGCRVADISGRVVRFRIFGPRAIAVLSSALKPSDVITSSAAHQKIASQKIPKIEEKHSTWLNDGFESSPKARCLHQRQTRRWSSLRAHVGSPHELPRDVVVALNVEDPRLTRPSKKTIPPSTIVDDVGEIVAYDARTAESSLWNPEVRRQVRDRKLTIADMYILRSCNLVPGTPLELGKYTSHLPIILCQHPGGGQGRVGDDGCWGSGVDILLPGGWGKDFWLSLIYNGARAGGLKEVAAANFENGILTFPRFFPDCVEGEAEAKATEVEAVDKYFARPIAKRVNFLSLGTHFPFRSPWSALVKEWGRRAGDGGQGGGDFDARDSIGFHVLRDRTALKVINEAVFASSDERPLRSLPHSNHPRFRSALVPVRVTCDSKGTILPFSMLCAPDEEDLKGRRRPPSKLAHVWTPPEEPLRWVSDENREHLKKAVKKGGKELGVGRFPVSVDHPDAVQSICSRRTMGFVVEGNLALTRGKPCGVGFVAGDALFHLAETCLRFPVGENNNISSAAPRAAANAPFLLCRCPNSRQYRRVDFEILY